MKLLKLFSLTFFLFLSLFSVSFASSSDKIFGEAWSSNIGWISFNNCTSSTSCSGVDYGVTADTSGNLSGQAWSSNIGWLSFNAGDVAGCPSGSCQPKINTTTGSFSGWARFTSFGGGWDGWVSLDGLKANSAGVISGQAWGSEVVGWIVPSADLKISPSSTYTITTSAGSNGMIDPTVIAAEHSDKPINFSASSGYHVSVVYIDGNSASISDLTSPYTFKDITSNHRIQVDFAKDLPSIGLCAPTHFNCAAGVATLKIGGTTGPWTWKCPGSVSTASCSESVYTISASAGPGGSISNPGNTIVSYNDILTYTFTPNSGYYTSKVLVDGISVSSLFNYTFANTTKNHTIVAEFTKLPNNGVCAADHWSCSAGQSINNSGAGPWSWSCKGLNSTVPCTQALAQCNNGIDDDGDGLIDLADPDCKNKPQGKETKTTYIFKEN